MIELSQFEPLKAWEYEALKADIAKRGVLVPIEYDQDGTLVDGRNRLRAVEELEAEGIIVEFPTSIRKYESEAERQLVSIILNTYRRQLAPIKRNKWLEAANQLRLELGYPDEPVLAPVKSVKTQSASDEPDALAARQREHRLQERMRPKVVLAANADPWLVADEALDCLERVRPYLVQLRAPLEDLEQAEELVKELAWGPRSEEAS